MRGQRTKRRVRRRSGGAGSEDGFLFHHDGQVRPVCPQVQYLDPYADAQPEKLEAGEEGEEDDSEGHDHSLLYIPTGVF